MYLKFPVRFLGTLVAHYWARASSGSEVWFGGQTELLYLSSILASPLNQQQLFSKNKRLNNFQR